MPFLHTVTVNRDFFISFGFDFVFQRRKRFDSFKLQCPRFVAELHRGALRLPLYFSGPQVIIYPGGVKRCHIRIMLFDTHFAPAPVATQGVHNQGPDVCLDIATVGEDRKKEEKKTKKLFGKATD